jgi:hypothetical protein
MGWNYESPCYTVSMSLPYLFASYNHNFLNAQLSNTQSIFFLCIHVHVHTHTHKHKHKHTHTHTHTHTPYISNNRYNYSVIYSKSTCLDRRQEGKPKETVQSIPHTLSLLISVCMWYFNCYCHSSVFEERNTYSVSLLATFIKYFLDSSDQT